MDQGQKSANPGRRARRDNLYRPREDGAEHSSLPVASRKTSLFLEAQMHPVATFVAAAGIGLAAAYLLRPRRETPHAVLERRERAAGVMGGDGEDWTGTPARGARFGRYTERDLRRASPRA